MSHIGPDPKQLPPEHSRSALAMVGIESFVRQMEHEFHPFGPPETGIDGSIELSDPATRSMTGKVIFVQSRSHKGEFKDETDDGFSFPLDRRDLDGWMAMTVPVILIVSRPKSDEYFWIDVKGYFEPPATRERSVVEFDKQRDRFDGGSGPDLFEVVEREANRRALIRQALIHGPVHVLGLVDELERARSADSERRFFDSAPLWTAIADAAEERLPAPFTWEFREREANALNTIGRRKEAYKIYLKLARDRLDANDPSAQSDIGRAFFTHVEQDFEFGLLAARAAVAVDGFGGIARLRDLHQEAPTTALQVEAAAALVDDLAFWGQWDDVIAVTEPIALKRLNPLRRQLLLDRLDALGERGVECEEEWERLLKSSRRAGDAVHAQTLQRRGVALSRAGDVDRAQACFHDAAEFWSHVAEADEQVAEALAGVEAAARLGGAITPDALPFAASQVVAAARGSSMLPVARAERLALAGLAALVDGSPANALRFLMSAAMLERRAGDLVGYLQATAGVARAHEAADEPLIALRWWIRTGRADRVDDSAAKLSYDTGGSALSLDEGPEFERAASFAALNIWAHDLSQTDVSELAETTLVQARERPRPLGPAASFQARRLLAQIAPKLSQTRAEAAAEILRDEVEFYGFARGESAGALAELTNRGVVDSIPFFVRLVLEEDDPGVSIAGYLRTAPDDLQRQVVAAARGGNFLALAEAAAADLPDRHPELRELCSREIQNLLDSEPEEGASSSPSTTAATRTSGGIPVAAGSGN